MASSSLAPLRSRNFALVWFAALVSNVGSWMQTVAVGVLVTELTHQARWAGLVAAAGFLPVGLLAPFGGAMADRHDRRLWLMRTTIGETLFATVLAVVVATGRATPTAVTLLVFGGGAMASVGFPAYSAMLADLVPAEDLLGAISLSSAQFNLGRVVGPALAGVVIVAGGYAWAFALNAASFGAVILALVLVRLPPTRPSTEVGGVGRRIATGARVAWADPGCRAAILTISVVALSVSPFIALMPAMAVKVLHEGRAGTSVLVTAQGIGAVLGALALAPLARRFGRRRVLVAALAILPVTVVAYALAPSLWWTALAILAVGTAYLSAFSGLNTVIQVRAPRAVRGRVLSLYMLALGTVYPVAAVVQGGLGDRYGLRVVTALAALGLLIAVGSELALRPRLAAAFDDPLPAVAGGTGAPAEPGGSGPPAASGAPGLPAVRGP
ncbi:MAG: MFS transporter [Acidimicrobiales bacterium]